MADNNRSLKKAAEILGSIDRHKKEADVKSQRQEKDFIAAVASKTVDALKPALNRIASQARITKSDMEDMVSKIEVTTNTPNVIVPDINVPKAEVTVRSPKIRLPDIKMPDSMTVSGLVGLAGVDLGNPLPVQLRTADGDVLDLLKGLSTAVSGGGGGGSARIVKINSSSSDPVNVTGSLTATLDADKGSGEIGSETLRIVQATNAISSVNIVSGSSSGTEYADGATADPATGTLSMGDTGEESANIYGIAIAEGATGSNTMRVNFATDSIASVNIVSGASSGTQYDDGDTASTPTGTVLMGDTGDESANVFAVAMASGATSSNSIRVVQATDSIGSVNVVSTVGLTDTELRASSVPIAQVSGATFSTNVLSTVGLTDTELRASTLDVKQVSGAISSVSVTNTVTVDLGADNDVVATGNVAHDAADSGNPLKIGFKARTANPTAVAANDRTDAYADTVGRQIIRPLQVRGLLQTAFAAVTSGTETTLLAGTSGVYHDLVYMIAANHSDAAVQVDIRQTTGGTIQMSLEVPANGTAGLSLGGATIPQDHADSTWTVDLGDDTQDCDVTALFSKEV